MGAKNALAIRLWMGPAWSSGAIGIGWLAIDPHFTRHSKGTPETEA